MNERPPTLGDVARLAGVSPATVSRVVNDVQPVRQQTVEAVRAAIAELGYRPNLAARALVTRRVGTIAVMVPETDERVFNDPWFPASYQGALDVFRGDATHVVLSMAHPSDGIEPMLAYLASGQIDGAIVLSHHGTEFARFAAEQPTPVVFVGDPQVAGLPFVDTDQALAARLATEHLLSKGCRKIASIAGPSDMVAGVRRQEHLERVLAEHDLQLLATAPGDFTRASGRSAAERLLDEGVDADGWFVASDLMAVGALDVLHERGIEVPDELRLVSIDNSAIGRLATPALTSVTNDGRELVRLASQMLREVLAGQTPESPRILAPELVVRESA